MKPLPHVLILIKRSLELIFEYPKISFFFGGVLAILSSKTFTQYIMNGGTNTPKGIEQTIFVIVIMTILYLIFSLSLLVFTGNEKKEDSNATREECFCVLIRNALFIIPKFIGTIFMSIWYVATMAWPYLIAGSLAMILAYAYGFTASTAPTMPLVQLLFTSGFILVCISSAYYGLKTFFASIDAIAGKQPSSCMVHVTRSVAMTQHRLWELFLDLTAFVLIIATSISIIAFIFVSIIGNDPDIDLYIDIFDTFINTLLLPLHIYFLYFLYKKYRDSQ